MSKCYWENGMIGILNVGLPLTIDGLKKNTVSASAVKQGIMWKVLALMLDSSTNANSSTNARTFHMIYNKAKCSKTRCTWIELQCLPRMGSLNKYV